MEISINQSINQSNKFMSKRQIHKKCSTALKLKLLLVSIFEKVALQEFLELFKSTIFDVTRQSVPQSRCIGRKGAVTKSNTPSPWLNKSSTIRARWSELPTSSYLKHICDIRWSLSMKSFVHKSKNFVINALFLWEASEVHWWVLQWWKGIIEGTIALILKHYKAHFDL